ncbi:CotH kinase family protein [Sutcliffiella rhizosphaerae]|uniref:Spore coat protein CotH n=1 Tax=Sutcliffiella rhizosphaerae TaxID=2880967 RepID=A0ABN8ABT3_9BACI|nr:CotH kinase family protein [Sutcliffiella rhizosphaerae]CAG9621396.1 hypothetical protein BACCIP111883_02169 [Sutcliffiella rhizosphaerae]
MKKWFAFFGLTLGIFSVFGIAFYLVPSQSSTFNERIELENQNEEKTQEGKNEIIDLYLDVREESLSYLYSRDRFDDNRIDGTVIIGDDTTKHQTEIRFRGNSSRGLNKKPLSLRFDKPKDFIFGGTHLNLNAMYTDPSLMREKISLDMFHDLGLLAPKTSYYNVYINGIFEGVYLSVDRIDEHMIAFTGNNPRGTLIRDQFRHNQHIANIEVSSIFNFDLNSVENKEEFLEQTTSYRNNPNWEAFMELQEWVYETEPGAEYAAEFGNYVDIPSFMDWLILHFLIADVDAFSDDYWMYLDQDDPEAKWQLIPWDKDLTFGAHYRSEVGTGNHYFAYESPVNSRFGNKLLEKFLATPEFRDMMNVRMEYLMKEVFTPNYFESKVAELSEVLLKNGEHTAEQSFILHRKNSIGEPEFEDYYKENLLDFVELRYQYLTQYLGGFGIEENHTSLDVSNVVKGETLYLTDQKGWVIGKIEVEENNSADNLSISIEQSTLSNEIDRVWTIQTSKGSLSGTLTLYYRNDTGWIGKENWYMEDTPTGDQWYMQLAEVMESSEIRTIPSYINPYSNKVVSLEILELKGTQQFLIKAQ